MELRPTAICRRLGIDDPRHIEVEAKKRVLPEQVKDLRKRLSKLKGVRHVKTLTFFDQFLDTARLSLLRAGASLRLRYKGDGSRVYLQYKGPGFHSQGLLFRSEFSSERLDHLVREESHHDIVHFSDTTLRVILDKYSEPALGKAMREHLGAAVVPRIDRGIILCTYRKDKFIMDLGGAFLEPSLDRLCAFHIGPKGLHPMSTFWEYENEIKAEAKELSPKLAHLDDLVRFDSRLEREFDLRPERLDKYHRLATCFVNLKNSLQR